MSFFINQNNGQGSGGTGTPGKSAYEIAVENGFVGTEKEWLESLKAQNVVDKIITVPIIDNVLMLTTDKYQITTMEDNTVITLPTVDKFTEIRLKFNTISELTLILPNIKWQNEIVIEANKTYEFIFTYWDNWLGGILSYE